MDRILAIFFIRHLTLARLLKISFFCLFIAFPLQAQENRDADNTAPIADVAPEIGQNPSDKSAMNQDKTNPAKLNTGEKPVNFETRQTQAKADKQESDKEIIARVEKYMTGLTTIVADFMQVAPDGSIATGKFYLQRPGKMRWQYDPPVPILMVTSGTFLTYYDYELEQVSHIPLESTLAGFIARETIRFDDKVKVESVEKQPGAIRISLTQADKPEEGRLLLEFSDNPLSLRNLVITDAQLQTTNISLNNAQFGVKLDEELFVFVDTRKKRRRQ